MKNTKSSARDEIFIEEMIPNWEKSKKIKLNPSFKYDKIKGLTGTQNISTKINPFHSMNLFSNTPKLPQQAQSLQNISIMSAPTEINFSPAQHWMANSPMTPQYLNVNQAFIHTVPAYCIHSPFTTFNQQINAPQMISASNLKQNLNIKNGILGNNYIPIDTKANSNSPMINNPSCFFNGFPIVNMPVQSGMSNFYGSEEATNLPRTIGYSNMMFQNSMAQQITGNQHFAQNLNSDAKFSNINSSSIGKVSPTSQGNIPFLTQASSMNSYLTKSMPLISNLAMQSFYNNSAMNKTGNINNIKVNTNGNQINPFNNLNKPLLKE